MAGSFQVALISPYSHVAAFGLRQISACLKQAGWDTRMLFLPDQDELRYLPRPHPQGYPPDVLEQVCALCDGADLVGISVMSNFVGRARALTRALHDRAGVPVIWGGIHPTVRPAECLAEADFVCLGEGEQAMLELVGRLAAGDDGTGISNIWRKDAQGQPVPTPVRPLQAALDGLPFPDYAIDSQYILHGGRLVPLDARLLALYMRNPFKGKPHVTYMTSASRGCPYECSYCCASAYTRLYPRWRKTRQRSHESVIEEIDLARRLIPGLQAIMFLDDAFLAASSDRIRRFSALYREQVGLPFFVLATPATVTREKLTCLTRAGLQDIEMGIQTGSPRMRALYNRTESNARILRAVRCINRFEESIPRPIYDLISDNPYETQSDRLETLHLLLQFPRPFTLHIHALGFFPGTELHRRAKADGLIADEERDVYGKNIVQVAPTYYNLVLRWLHRPLPRRLLGLLIQPALVRLLSSPSMQGPMRLVWKLFDALRRWRTNRWYRASFPAAGP
jgi:anaerobic magnesium-protoporphyrin IX monomethyl ester cyclase